MSLATLQFSSFAYSENKKQGQELNILLKKLDLDTVPIVEHYPQFRKNSISNSTEDDGSGIQQQQQLQQQQESSMELNNTNTTSTSI
jgi:hypothetical protein